MSLKIHTADELQHANVNIQEPSSMTQQALLLAALADGVSEISGLHIDNETNTLVTALAQLGIITHLDTAAQSCMIAGGNGMFPKKEASIWCEGSPTVARFLLAACGGSSGTYSFDGSEDIGSLVGSALLKILSCQGVQFNSAHNTPLTLIGADSLEGGEITFDPSVSSQTMSALLMIAPYARTAVHFNVPSDVNQQALDLTCNMMAEFGVLVRRIHHNQLMVPVPQRYGAIKSDLKSINTFS